LLPERQFIESIRRLAGKGGNRSIVRGIGDDCAILQVPGGSQLLVTTDLCIEGIHFRREWHSATSVGHRCLARGLSDIAAMGGEPIACFLSLGVPGQLPKKWADEFLHGMLRLARRFAASLAGGDTSSAKRITADIVVLGSIPAGGAVLRSGARVGDCIYVSGELGGSAAVLQSLDRGKKISPAASQRYFYPEPRVKVGRWLRQRGSATAMIDLSDGLSVDLAHICQESGISAVIDERAIPIAKGANLESALHGGEDYELLFTTRPGAKLPPKIAGVPVTMIGEIEPKSPTASRLRIRDGSGHLRLLKSEGWQHFVKRQPHFVKK